ncbi:hypothetical protein CHLNCDRAFT_36346 [Chlorella variabilis]|uniref:Succinyl-CoA:3-ketoacid-coenzyme A transferase n=1 Tax=Chlorella variabilis TaxID=554065 RepID=E1ZKC9_CHLVA|nr:hypothetical protein CHLNCDRAFT_36346 [Chlorella variabilis]EFN53785.1 hypothetical protein CHLNCDRAFT_36346 [Chlorella variabilis]|eukprot:XP_005845887.1 hypothetical protein CHLNCDRAFT_36346 [Chlorella variabilis]
MRAMTSTADERDDPRAAYRLQQLRRHLVCRPATAAASELGGPLAAAWCKAADNTSVQDASKVVSAEEAAALIPDGVWLTPAGFVGTSCPEALLNAVRRQYEATGHPRGLGLIYAASAGNSKGRGLDQLAVEGLVDRLIYGWTGTAPGFLKLVRENKVQAYNLPLGVVSHMIRDVAAKRAGPVTHVGLGTFVDPREKGGKLNSVTTRDIVHVLNLGGRELLWYQAPDRISVALLRGSTADLDGNVSFEHEALFTDQLNQALAAHNGGGLVIVQVHQGGDRGTLHPKDLHLPGAIVDRVVVAPPELHWQSFRDPHYDGSLSGEIRTPLHSILPLPLDERRIIAHRAMLEIDQPNCIVNLGVGMPEGVAVMVATHGAAQNPYAASVTLSTEAGAFGGIPGGGLRFGSSHNPACLVPTASMIDFYNGSGVDVACLGLAEVDPTGSVNVSNFGNGRMPGCGGFIDISQTAKKVLFVGTFTSSGLKVAVEAGRLAIRQEGSLQKFRRAVHEKTFAGASANGRTVLYITERAVFRLAQQQPGAGASACVLELVEVAPGIDIERDILPHMEFRPLVRSVRQMPPQIFIA